MSLKALRLPKMANPWRNRLGEIRLCAETKIPLTCPAKANSDFVNLGVIRIQCVSCQQAFRCEEVLFYRNSAYFTAARTTYLFEDRLQSREFALQSCLD